MNTMAVSRAELAGRLGPPAPPVDIELENKYCPDCRDLGQQVAGTQRIGRRWFCDAHFAKRLGQRPRMKLPAETLEKLYPTDSKPARRRKMQGRLSKADWTKAQDMRDSGKRVREIAELLGTSDVTVYAHTSGSRKRRTTKNHEERAQKLASSNGKIRFVELSEVPGLRWTHHDPDYEAIWTQVRICPKGKAVCAPIPARLRKDPEPQKNLGGAMRRCAKRDGMKLGMTCVAAGGLIYIVVRKK